MPDATVNPLSVQPAPAQPPPPQSQQSQSQEELHEPQKTPQQQAAEQEAALATRRAGLEAEAHRIIDRGGTLANSAYGGGALRWGRDWSVDDAVRVFANNTISIAEQEAQVQAAGRAKQAAADAFNAQRPELLKQYLAEGMQYSQALDRIDKQEAFRVRGISGDEYDARMTQNTFPNNPNAIINETDRAAAIGKAEALKISTPLEFAKQYNADYNRPLQSPFSDSPWSGIRPDAAAMAKSFKPQGDWASGIKPPKSIYESYSIPSDKLTQLKEVALASDKMQFLKEIGAASDSTHAQAIVEKGFSNYQSGFSTWRQQKENSIGILGTTLSERTAGKKGAATQTQLLDAAVAKLSSGDVSGAQSGIKFVVGETNFQKILGSNFQETPQGKTYDVDIIRNVAPSEGLASFPDGKVLMKTPPYQNLVTFTPPPRLEMGAGAVPMLVQPEQITMPKAAYEYIATRQASAQAQRLVSMASEPGGLLFQTSNDASILKNMGVVGGLGTAMAAAVSQYPPGAASISIPAPLNTAAITAGLLAGNSYTATINRQPEKYSPIVSTEGGITSYRDPLSGELNYVKTGQPFQVESPITEAAGEFALSFGGKQAQNVASSLAKPFKPIYPYSAFENSRLWELEAKKQIEPGSGAVYIPGQPGAYQELQSIRRTQADLGFKAKGIDLPFNMNIRPQYFEPQPGENIVRQGAKFVGGTGFELYTTLQNIPTDMIVRPLEDVSQGSKAAGSVTAQSLPRLPAGVLPFLGLAQKETQGYLKALTEQPSSPGAYGAFSFAHNELKAEKQALSTGAGQIELNAALTALGPASGTVGGLGAKYVGGAAGAAIRGGASLLPLGVGIHGGLETAKAGGTTYDSSGNVAGFDYGKGMQAGIGGGLAYIVGFESLGSALNTGGVASSSLYRTGKLPNVIPLPSPIGSPVLTRMEISKPSKTLPGQSIFLLSGKTTGGKTNVRYTAPISLRVENTAGGKITNLGLQVGGIRGELNPSGYNSQGFRISRASGPNINPKLPYNGEITTVSPAMFSSGSELQRIREVYKPGTTAAQAQYQTPKNLLAMSKTYGKAETPIEKQIAQTHAKDLYEIVKEAGKQTGIETELRGSIKEKALGGIKRDVSQSDLDMITNDRPSDFVRMKPSSTQLADKVAELAKGDPRFSKLKREGNLFTLGTKVLDLHSDKLEYLNTPLIGDITPYGIRQTVEYSKKGQAYQTSGGGLLDKLSGATSDDVQRYKDIGDLNMMLAKARRRGTRELTLTETAGAVASRNTAELQSGKMDKAYSEKIMQTRASLMKNLNPTQMKQLKEYRAKYGNAQNQPTPQLSRYITPASAVSSPVSLFAGAAISIPKISVSTPASPSRSSASLISPSSSSSFPSVSPSSSSSSKSGSSSSSSSKSSSPSFSSLMASGSSLSSISSPSSPPKSSSSSSSSKSGSSSSSSSKSSSSSSSSKSGSSSSSSGSSSGSSSSSRGSSISGPPSLPSTSVDSSGGFRFSTGGGAKTKKRKRLIGVAPDFISMMRSQSLFGKSTTVLASKNPGILKYGTSVLGYVPTKELLLSGRAAKPGAANKIFGAFKKSSFGGMFKIPKFGKPKRKG